MNPATNTTDTGAAIRTRLINPLLAKVLTIGLLTVLLLIPLSQVRSVLGERIQLRHSAISKVANGWGGNQLLGGPVLNVPYEIVSGEGDRAVRTLHTHRILASEVRMHGQLQPQMRYVGIYSVPVYTLQLQIDGLFDPGSVRELAALMNAPGHTVHWERASLFLAIDDPKGIRKVDRARWGDAELKLEPGRYETLAGVSADVHLDVLRQDKEQPFSFRLDVAGTESLRLLPMAGTTEVVLKSTWPDPSFSGTYAPADYAVEDTGFAASWQVLELNRQFPQQWHDQAVSAQTLREAGFGVDLFQPVDTYQRNERATKYAVLFIALTFMSVFLWEILAGVRIHAMQYLLVGLALSVFYLLVLALSEHLPFGLGYLTGAVALTALIGVYLGGAMRSRRAGIVAGGMIAVVYGLLYLLVLSEQYALLLGAIVLFGVLAAIMLLTRRYDWHAFGRVARPPA